MLLLLKICGILGFVFCLVMLGFSLKLKKTNSKKFQKKIGLIFMVSLALFSFSQYKLSQHAAVKRETYTISSKSTLEGTQTFLRVLVFSKDKDDLEAIFKTLEKKEKKEGVDSLFVRFNIDNGGEIGKFIANGKVAWTKKGEKQVGLKQNKMGFDYNKELN